MHGCPSSSSTSAHIETGDVSGEAIALLGINLLPQATYGKPKAFKAVPAVASLQRVVVSAVCVEPVWPSWL